MDMFTTLYRSAAAWAGLVASGGSTASSSEREHEVLVLVADGLSDSDIAKGLFVSRATVKTHLSHLFEKLGVDARTPALAMAGKRGLLD